MDVSRSEVKSLEKYSQVTTSCKSGRRQENPSPVVSSAVSNGSALLQLRRGRYEVKYPLPLQLLFGQCRN